MKRPQLKLDNSQTTFIPSQYLQTTVSMKEELELKYFRAFECVLNACP